MTRKLRPLPGLAVAAGLSLAGCGKSGGETSHAGHDHGAHARQEGETPARFKAGAGLLLSPETVASLGLKSGEAQERPVRHAYEITASVFDAGPPARAVALVPRHIADDLEKHPPAEARLLAVRRDLVPALDQTEIVLALTGTPAAGTTVTLNVSGVERTGLALPRAALLRTSAGDFVYVQNGAHWLRTAVKPGAGDEHHLEILDGIYAGDIVATAGVEQLWLTELRLTKGGGHSH